MKNKITTLLILILVIFPVISADVIMPGYKVIDVKNKITNIGDYPDYIFVLGGGLEGPSPMYVKVQIVGEDGIIPGGYYKFSSPSVFAIEKDKWDEELMSKFMIDEPEYEGYDNYQDFYSEYIGTMESMSAKEVIKNLYNQNQVPESSSVESETKTYTIDLQKVKVEPDNNEVERKTWKYLIYFGLPIIALALIIYIINKRK